MIPNSRVVNITALTPWDTVYLYKSDYGREYKDSCWYLAKGGKGDSRVEYWKGRPVCPQIRLADAKPGTPHRWKQRQKSCDSWTLYVYDLTHGNRQWGMDIHHRCENPSCVNPYHLVGLTKQDHVAVHHYGMKVEDCLLKYEVEKRARSIQAEKDAQKVWAITHPPGLIERFIAWFNNLA
jgi:hypothetical protein